MIDKSVPAPARARDGWFTSSFTNGSGACVEVRFGDGTVLVRDTKDRRPIIAVTPVGWATFVSTLSG